MSIMLVVMYAVTTLLSSMLDLCKIKRIWKMFGFTTLLLLALYIGCIFFPISKDIVNYQNVHFAFAADDFNFQEWTLDVRDYGIIWFMTVVKSLNGNLYDFYFILTLIVLGLYFIRIPQYTKYIFTAWMMVVARNFAGQNITQIRQGFANVIMMFSLKYVKERKPLKFTLTILIASLMHQSLIVALIIYPLCKIQWNAKKIITIFVISFYACYTPISKMVILFFISQLGIYSPKMSIYIPTMEDNSFFTDSNVITFALVAIISAMLFKKIHEGYNHIFLTMFMLGILVTGLFHDIPTLAGRLSSIFFMAWTFTPGVAYDFAKDRWDKVIAWVMITILGSFFMYKNFILYLNP